MAFTYDLATAAGQIRLEIGDTAENAGVKPAGANFSDAEIDHLLAAEGSVGRAAARAAEILASTWASQPKKWRLGPESEEIDTVAHWQSEAERLRGLYGWPETVVGAPFDWYDPDEQIYT